MPDFDILARKFDQPGVEALALMGSHARGTAGQFSDVDLVRFLGEGAVEAATGDGSYILDGVLVNASSATPQQVEAWFSRPELAVQVIAGLRTARPLLDRNGRLAAVQQRARAFVWEAEMQAKANRWASQQMVGWIEEVFKGLEGLRRDDTGRLLNARFGCSWGLSRVMGVQKGVLLSGDNGFYEEIGQAVGMDSEWVRLRRTAFGIEDPQGQAPDLRAQVRAGLRLYAETSRLLREALEPTDSRLIEDTVRLIEMELGSP